MYHVYPTNDEKPHVLEGTGCACGPSVLWNDPETNEPFSTALVVHNAWDCREVVERAQKILDQLQP